MSFMMGKTRVKISFLFFAMITLILSSILILCSCYTYFENQLKNEIESEAKMAQTLGLKTKKVSRRARFKSVITIIIDGKIHLFEGTLEGEIARKKSGNGGFGYDPIFIADEFPGQTLADISEEQKNDISHRGKALRNMAQWLKENIQ